MNNKYRSAFYQALIIFLSIFMSLGSFELSRDVFANSPDQEEKVWIKIKAGQGGRIEVKLNDNQMYATPDPDGITEFQVMKGSNLSVLIDTNENRQIDKVFLNDENLADIESSNQEYRFDLKARSDIRIEAFFIENIKNPQSTDEDLSQNNPDSENLTEESVNSDQNSKPNFSEGNTSDEAIDCEPDDFAENQADQNKSDQPPEDFSENNPSNPNADEIEKTDDESAADLSMQTVEFSPQAKKLYEQNNQKPQYSQSLQNSASLEWIPQSDDQKITDGLLEIRTDQPFDLMINAALKAESQNNDSQNAEYQNREPEKIENTLEQSGSNEIGFQKGQLRFVFDQSFFEDLNGSEQDIEVTLDDDAFGLCKNEDQIILINTKDIPENSWNGTLQIFQKNIQPEKLFRNKEKTQTEISSKMITIKPEMLVDDEVQFSLHSNTLSAVLTRPEMSMDPKDTPGATISKTGAAYRIMPNSGSENIPDSIVPLPQFQVYSPTTGETNLAYCCMPQVPEQLGAATEYNLPEWTSQRLNGNIRIMTESTAKYLAGMCFYFYNHSHFGSYGNAIDNMTPDSTLCRGLLAVNTWRIMAQKHPYLSPVGIHTSIYTDGYYIDGVNMGASISDQKRLFQDAYNWCTANFDNPDAANGRSLSSLAFALRFYKAAGQSMSTAQGVVSYRRIPMLPEIGHLSIQKKSLLPDISNSNNFYSVAGAEYTVYDSSNQAVAVMTIGDDSNDNWSNIVELPFGNYTYKETKPAKGYTLDPTIYSVTIDQASAHPAGFKNMHHVYAKDTPKSCPVKIVLQKVDDQTGKNEPQGSGSLADAEFTLKFYAGVNPNLNQNPTKTWVMKTNQKGEIRFEDTYKVSGDAFYLNSRQQPCLPAGILIIEETKAPEGYMKSDEVITMIIDPTLETEDAMVYQVPECKERPVEAMLIKKQADSNVGIEGAVFEWTDPSSIKRQLTTDSDGKIVLKGLSEGKHTLKEIEAPEGYQNLKEEIFLNVKDQKPIWQIPSDANWITTEGRDDQVIVFDEVADWSVSIIKKDDQNNPLENALFTLYQDEQLTNPIASLNSDKHGNLQFDNLKNNTTYYLEETRSPEGYPQTKMVWKLKAKCDPAKNQFEVLVNDQPSSSISIHEKRLTLHLDIMNIPGMQLPDTGLKDQLVLCLLVLTLMFAGFCLNRLAGKENSDMNN